MTFALALDGRFEPIGNRSFGSPEAQDVPAGSAGTPSSSVNVGDTSATAVANTPATNSSSLTFKDAFGADARLVRTNDPNNMFAVETVTANTDPGQVDDTGWRRPTDNPWGQWSATTSARWNYDAKTQTFTSPDGKKKVSAASLGIGGASDGRAVPFLLAPLATEAGQNGDSWSNYALTHNSYGDGKQGSSSFRLAGAQDLMKASGDIISYDAKVSGFDKFLESAVIGGITTIATMGFGAPLAASMQAAGYSAVTAATVSNAVVGAAMGGGVAAITGGDPLKGALLGGAGGAIDGYSSTLSKTGGLLSTSNMVNTAGKTALAAVSGGDPVATLASSVAGSAAGAATGSPFVGQLASQATRQLVTKQPTQSISQGRPSTSTKAAQSTQSTQNTPGASFSYSLPSFNYVDLMGKRG